VHSLQDLGDSGEDLAALKRRIMEWLKSRTKGHPDVHVTNFTDSLADGKAFMALMHGAGVYILTICDVYNVVRSAEIAYTYKNTALSYAFISKHYVYCNYALPVDKVFRASVRPDA
jgi:Calponin homology (CH) domain